MSMTIAYRWSFEEQTAARNDLLVRNARIAYIVQNLHIWHLSNDDDDNNIEASQDGQILIQ